MQLFRIRSAVIGAAAFLGAFASEETALAAPKDAAALRLADQAIDGDYLAAKPKAAETKLRKALELCKADACSPNVVARIYRDLGVVQLAGLKKGQAAREAFARAVQADPEIRLEKDLATPELSEAFTEMGGQRGFAPPKSKSQKRAAKPPEDEDEVVIEERAPAPAPKARRSKPRRGDASKERVKKGGGDEEPIVLEEEPERDAEPSEVAPKPAAPAKKNYFSVALQQDFLIHSGGAACFGGEYACFDSDEEYTGTIYEGAGNEVKGGLGIATTRLMVGYDRLLLENVLAGARLGFAFGGGPTPPSTGDGFLPIHVELRAQYHLFDAPFSREGLRPYVGLGLGFAEVDSKVKVRLYESEQAFQQRQGRSLDAWRKTGKSFIAPTLGSAYAFGGASSVFVELRPVIMLGAAGFAPAFALGYAHAL